MFDFSATVASFIWSTGISKLTVTKIACAHKFKLPKKNDFGVYTRETTLICGQKFDNSLG